MKTPKTLFLAWKDPISPYWFTIGRLTFDGSIYQFVYTQGVKEAEEKCAFKPFAPFPRLDEIYTSTYLFSVFANRVMSRSRPDYSSFIEQLDLLGDDPSPMAILSRSGGERVTDTFAVFPCPEADEAGQYNLYFFSQGLRHLPGSAIERIDRLEAGEMLEFDREVPDLYSDRALITSTGDRCIVGYFPRYLLAEIFELLRHDVSLKVRVERVNQPTTPFQFRLLCKMSIEENEDFRPFSSDRYQPLITEIAVKSA
ncbi:MAG: DNA-binding protein [Richelia sp. CSU_2_1]|nr:DNA-binding protein [Richelia sp. CSU_2_1]